MKTIYYIFLLFLLPTINFYSKIFFILSLIILNFVLIYKKVYPSSDEPEARSKGKSIINQRVLQSGFYNKNLKGFLPILGAVGGSLSAFITVKNELRDIQIGRVNHLQEAEREGIRKSIDQDKEEHQRLLNTIEENRDELLKLYGEKTKLIGQNDRLLTLHQSIKDKVTSFKEKSIEDTSKLSDLGIIDQLIKQDTNKFTEEVNYLILEIEKSYSNLHSVSPPKVGQEDLQNQEISKSSILNLDFSSILEHFESLNGIKKIAVSLILGKSVIFSSLLTLIFIFYGNILIEKYNLESRFPKLARIIQLRRKFQKYYFNLNCIFILTIIITEISLSLALLFL